MPGCPFIVLVSAILIERFMRASEKLTRLANSMTTWHAAGRTGGAPCPRRRAFEGVPGRDRRTPAPDARTARRPRCCSWEHAPGVDLDGTSTAPWEALLRDAGRHYGWNDHWALGDCPLCRGRSCRRSLGCVTPIRGDGRDLHPHSTVHRDDGRFRSHRRSGRAAAGAPKSAGHISTRWSCARTVMTDRLIRPMRRAGDPAHHAEDRRSTAIAATPRRCAAHPGSYGLRFVRARPARPCQPPPIARDDSPSLHRRLAVLSPSGRGTPPTRAAARAVTPSPLRPPASGAWRPDRPIMKIHRARRDCRRRLSLGRRRKPTASRPPSFGATRPRLRPRARRRCQWPRIATEMVLASVARSILIAFTVDA